MPTKPSYQYPSKNDDEALEGAIYDYNEPQCTDAAINMYNNSDGAIPATQPQITGSSGRTTTNTSNASGLGTSTNVNPGDPTYAGRTGTGTVNALPDTSAQPGQPVTVGRTADQTAESLFFGN